MQIHDLKPVAGSSKKRKRVGRGRRSGYGKTCGRGHNGQLSRSGGGKGAGFEGGQNPLQRRLPKLPGFTNHFKKVFAVVNISKLDEFENGDVIDRSALFSKGMIRKGATPIKILGDGDLKKKLTVKAAAFTPTAKSKIEAAGGKTEVV